MKNLTVTMSLENKKKWSGKTLQFCSQKSVRTLINICTVGAKKGLLFSPNKTASSPFSAANFSRAMRRSSYVLPVFSSRAWLSFFAVSLAPATRLGASSELTWLPLPQLFTYHSTFGLLPLQFPLVFEVAPVAIF